MIERLKLAAMQAAIILLVIGFGTVIIRNCTGKLEGASFVGAPSPPTASR